MTSRFRSALALACFAAVFTGCASTRQPVALDQARQLYQRLQAEGVAAQAEAELIRTEQAISRADSAVRTKSPQAYADELAHVALRRAQIAEAENLARIATARADTLRLQRLQRLVTLTQAQRDQLATQQQLSEQEIEELRRRNLMQQERAVQAEQQADSLRRVAEDQRRKLEESVRQLRSLIAEISDLRETQRGLVISLSDVLFDVNQAVIRQGARRSVERIAAVLQQYPDYQIAVEGHTDSTGPADHNQRLSEQRAEAVLQALVQAGVPAARVQSRGFGQTQPVSTNATAAGRQQNRRVEVIVLGASALSTESPGGQR